jgi:hypothetical protein
MTAADADQIRQIVEEMDAAKAAGTLDDAAWQQFYERAKPYAKVRGSMQPLLQRLPSGFRIRVND